MNRFVDEHYDLLAREGVLTLDKIMMTPNMRTGCANAGRVGMTTLTPAA